MKATELMLGDWVYDSVLKSNTKVEVLSLSGIRGDINDNVWREKTFEPIPLTREILEKNGFKEDSTYNLWLFADDYYDVIVKEWCDSIWIFRYDNTEMNTPHEQMVFSYVHSLQHAFRHCGIDKEVII